MALISERVHQLEESETIKMAKLGRELSLSGVSIINLSFGEPDFDTPQHIKEAAIEAIRGRYSHYTPVAGYAELREAIAEKLSIENSLEFLPDQIVVSTGAKQSLANAVMCMLDPGDEVLIPTPYWVSYSEMVKLGQGTSVFVHTSADENFKISPARLEAAITINTKLFMFSSPSNPTGSIYSREELEALARVFEKHPRIYVISDEIYEHINYSGRHESIAQFKSIKDRVILINGVSKAYAMTGWRIGYMAANKEIARACEKLQSQVTSGTCSISQRAALAAISGPLTATTMMRDAFRSRRDRMFNALSKIEGLKCNLPSGAFYFFPEISSIFGMRTPQGEVISDSTSLCLYLLHKARVSTVPGLAFGNDRHLRISYAADDASLVEAVDRISGALRLLKF